MDEDEPFVPPPPSPPRWPYFLGGFLTTLAFLLAIWFVWP